MGASVQYVVTCTGLQYHWLQRICRVLFREDGGTLWMQAPLTPRDTLLQLSVAC